MSRIPLVTDRLPQSPLPYSIAVSGPAQLWLSGIVGVRPGSYELAGETAAQQLRQIFENLDAILAEAGKTHDDVLKMTLYLTDMSEFMSVNEVYGAYFAQPYPARTAVGVKELPIDARVEVDVVVA